MKAIVSITGIVLGGIMGLVYWKIFQDNGLAAWHASTLYGAIVGWFFMDFLNELFKGNLVKQKTKK